MSTISKKTGEDINIPHIVTISGPSLSGKTELSNLLEKELGYNRIVSVTTRERRSQEVDGVDYHFISNNDFDEFEKSGLLVQKTENGNIRYGVTTLEVLKKSDKPMLWVIMPKSIDQVEDVCKKEGFNLTKVFIKNPEQVLFKRLFERFKNDKLATVESYAKRLEEMITLEKEWEFQASFDLLLPEFTKETENDVVNLIKDKVSGITNVKSISKSKGLK